MSVLRGRATPLEPLPAQAPGTCACGCGKPVSARFLLGHQRAARGPLAVVFEGGFVTPCWRWVRAFYNSGYGECGSRSEGTRDLAHRAVYKEMVGPIPEGLTLDHLCFNGWCVNPGHLEPVTLAENTRRQWRAGRARPNIRQAAKTHCVRGHEFTAANTLVCTGRRRCRACARERAREVRAEGARA